MRQTTLTRLGALGLVSSALLFGACSDDGGDTTATTAASGGDDTATTAADGGGGEGGTLTIENFAFSDITVAPGATVSVQNSDGTRHTVTPDEDGAFEAVELDGGASGETTAPSEAGDYDFHCAIHSSMHGTLHVEG